MDSDDIDKLARLAGLRLDDEEREALSGELDEIVAYVERLDDADTESVEPLRHPVPEEALDRDGRADEVDGEVGRDALMANAPAVRDGEFEVPDVDNEGQDT